MMQVDEYTFFSTFCRNNELSGFKIVNKQELVLHESVYKSLYPSAPFSRLTSHHLAPADDPHREDLKFHTQYLIININKIDFLI